jgi:hypothetical protein
MQNNEIRRRITKIATFFDRFLAFIFCILVIFAFADAKTGVLTLFAALIHELGHVSYLFISRGRLYFPSGALNGFKIKHTSLLSYPEQILLYASGPLFNLIAALVALPFFGANHGYVELFALINLTTAISNLLPIQGYDGYGIICTFLKWGGLFGSFHKVVYAISFSFTVLLSFISLYLMLRFGSGYWIYAVFFLSVFSTVRAVLKRQFFEF